MKVIFEQQKLANPLAVNIITKKNYTVLLSQWLKCL